MHRRFLFGDVGGADRLARAARSCAGGAGGWRRDQANVGCLFMIQRPIDYAFYCGKD